MNKIIEKQIHDLREIGSKHVLELAWLCAKKDVPFVIGSLYDLDTLHITIPQFHVFASQTFYEAFGEDESMRSIVEEIEELSKLLDEPEERDE